MHPHRIQPLLTARVEEVKQPEAAVADQEKSPTSRVSRRVAAFAARGRWVNEGPPIPNNV